jgi:hypothetical protein
MGGWSSSGNVTTTNDSVGIGSTSPVMRVHVEGTSDQGSGLIMRRSDNSKFMRLGVGSSGVALDFDSSSYFVIQNNGAMGTGGYFDGSELLRITADGVVKIPGELVVSGQGWSMLNGIATSLIAMGDPTVQGTMLVSGAQGKIVVTDNLTESKIGPNNPYSPPAGFNLVSWAPNTLGPTMTLTNLGGGAQAAAAIDFTTSSPSGSAPTTARIMATDNGNGASSLTFLTPGAPNGGLLPSMVITADGKVGIGTPPSSRLHVAGDISVTGDVLLTGADCAEHFDVGGDEPLDPGTVAVIDEDGALRKSRQAYDKKVAGIVSGVGQYRHGIVLDRRSSADERVPIALVGKVYCKVDAAYSPIEVGDLLTTSPTEGHAMKATDALKAFGSVIGKALKSFDGGRGMIPVLVALQ